jgi:GcrA cell cycle regulator
MSLTYFDNPHNRYISQWTQERVETLKQLWADGLSASEIASSKRLNTTRNAVIGKVWRLKVSARSWQPGPHKPRRANGTPKPPPLPPRPKPPPPPTPIAPQMRELTIFRLQPHHCRWPLGNWLEPARLFCAADTHEGEIYCPFHQAKARVR